VAFIRGKRKRKRDPSTTRAGSFAGAKEKKKLRPASVGMIVFLHMEGCCGCSSNALVNDKDAI